MKSKIILVLCLFISLTAFSQTTSHLIRVQGNAVIRELPELMVFSISVEAKDSLYSNCSDLLISKYNQLETSFETNGIEKKELKSSDLNINEYYTWNGRERKLQGYQGTISLTLELPYKTKLLNTIVQTLRDSEFPVSYQLAFKLSQKQKDILRKKAIELAIDDAREKATTIANAMNFKLGKINDINFGYVSYKDDLLANESQVFYKVENEQRANLSSSLDLNPKTIELKKTIGVIWTIEQ